jgi:hypothetical protein
MNKNVVGLIVWGTIAVCTLLTGEWAYFGFVTKVVPAAEAKAMGINCNQVRARLLDGDRLAYRCYDHAFVWPLITTQYVALKKSETQK